MSWKIMRELEIVHSDVPGEKPEPTKNDIGKIFLNTIDKKINIPYFENLIPTNLELNSDSILPNTLKAKLYHWKGKFSGNNLLLEDGTVITVVGKDFSTSYIPSVSLAVFHIPDELISSDTDEVWYRSNDTLRDTTVAELVGYDFAKTIVKYADSPPYNISEFAIVKFGETLTTDEINEAHAYFHLPLFWSGTLNTFGYPKANRLLSRSIFTPDVITLPSITEISSSAVQDLQFTIGATINPEGLSTIVTVEYGLTTAYGSVQSIVTGSPVTVTGAISAVLSNLEQLTLYHYRVKAVNSSGTTYSPDYFQTTTKVAWVLQVNGITSGTPTDGTLIVALNVDQAPTVTGDIVIVSNTPAADSTKFRRTLVFNIPNNGSGKIVLPDRNNVLALGGYQNAPQFYAGTAATLPKITTSWNNLPSSVISIRQDTVLGNALLISGNQAFPAGLLHLRIIGGNLSWTFNGPMPTGLITLRIDSAFFAWTYDGAMPANLTTLYMYTFVVHWTGTTFGDTATFGTFNLNQFRTGASKVTDDEMLAILTNLKNRTGGVCSGGTVTINEYKTTGIRQDVLDMKALLQTAKNCTVVLGA